MAAVLFVGEACAARAPMAEAVARHVRPDLEVWAAGAHPSHVRPEVRRVLDEVGIPAGGLRARGMLEVDMEDVVLVVSLCLEHRRPRLPRRYEVVSQPIADPSCAPAHERDEAYRACRDALMDRLPRLLARHLPS
jgi:protein-tyrosine-phosphatase